MLPSFSDAISALVPKNYITSGSFKSCFRVNDDFVCLIPSQSNSKNENFEWLRLLVENGMIAGCEYDNCVFVVEVIDVTAKTPLDNLFEKTRLEYVKKHYPLWADMIKLFDDVFAYTELDFRRPNFGVAKDGRLVLFDIFV